jgi:hypothetical protein
MPGAAGKYPDVAVWSKSERRGLSRCSTRASYLAAAVEQGRGIQMAAAEDTGGEERVAGAATAAGAPAGA